MGTASSHRHQSDSLSVQDSQDQSRYHSSASTPSTGDNKEAKSERSQQSGLSVVSNAHTGQRPIVAVAHRYQRSWKSRLAASMRQARDFLSRPRASSGRNFSSARRAGYHSAGLELGKDSKLDINSATKAELQQLPGVDGSLASAIIEHRKLLVGGRFKRLDDLVNVPGLDVEKLNRFRDLIVIPRIIKPSASGENFDPTKASGIHLNGSPTVSSNVSDSATLAPGMAHMTVSPSYPGPRLSADSAPVSTPLASTALLNINKATEQDFVQTAGLPEDVARKIVMARQNNGPFHAVSDIRRIKGVSKSLFVRVRERLMIEEPLAQKPKMVPPTVAISASGSSGNCRPSETDSGIATLSVAAASLNSNSGQGNNALVGSVASANTSKQVSPDSTVRDMDINNLPDVIIKYTKPSDLELIHKLQMNSSTAARGGRGRGLAVRGHSRNVSDFGVIADYNDIFSPVYPSDMHGIRPIVEPFDFRAAAGSREPVVRVAFWDIEECGMDKISNPGVLETICMTILENGISIVAFTDLLDARVADRIADQLTWPSLHCVREWRGGRGSWRSAVVKTGYCGTSGSFEADSRSRTSSGGSSNGDCEGEKQPVYCGFVYDTSRSIEMVGRCHYSSPLQQSHHKCDDTHDSKSAHPECLTVALPKTALHRLAFRPAAAKFSLSGPSSADGSVTCSHLAFVCLKLSPDDSAFFKRRDIALSTAPLLTSVLDAVNAFGDVSTNKTAPMPIILAGSFGVDASERCFDLLRVAGYQLVSSEKTNISRKQPAGTICGDQVWFTDVGASSSAVRQFTGRASVVRKALTHPQIPDGWAWGGLVSSHCPVWAEFFTVPQPCENGNHESSGE